MSEGGPSDGVVGGPKTPQQIAASRRLQQTQAQVDEVVGIMRMNVEKVIERDQKLSELDDRTDALQQGASQFEQQAGKLKRKFWLKNLKMMIILGIIGLVILIILGDFYLEEWLWQQEYVESVWPLGNSSVDAATSKSTLDLSGRGGNSSGGINSVNGGMMELIDDRLTETETLPPGDGEPSHKLLLTMLDRGHDVLDPAFLVDFSKDPEDQPIVRVPFVQIKDDVIVNDHIDDDDIDPLQWRRDF